MNRASGLGLALCLAASPALAQDAGPVQEVRHFEVELWTGGSLDYLLYRPPGYDERPAWPLLLFLHGAGERGADPSQVTLHGPPAMIERGRRFPFIVASPQAPAGETWRADLLYPLVRRLADELRVDPDRIYVTGLSMGAYGAWDLAIAHPDLFAAVVAVSGSGNPAEVCRLKDTAVWIFHGADDPVIPVEGAQTMAERLERCGGNVRITVYPDVGHDAWTRTYHDEALYAWLLEQRRTPR